MAIAMEFSCLLFGLVNSMCLFCIYVLSFLLLHGYFIVAVTTLWSFIMLISTIWPVRTWSGVVKTQKKDVGVKETRLCNRPEGGWQLNELSRSRFSDNKFRFSAITILRASARNFIEAKWFSLITLWVIAHAWIFAPEENMSMAAKKKGSLVLSNKSSKLRDRYQTFYVSTGACTFDFFLVHICNESDEKDPQKIFITLTTTTGQLRVLRHVANRDESPSFLTNWRVARLVEL